MPFQTDRFETTKFEPRKTRVPVPALASFFDEGEVAEWEVRGLTASELHRAMEAGRRQSTVEGILKALSHSGDQVTALRAVLGLSTDTPSEVAKRLEMLVAGSVAPQVTLPQAVKLGEAFPIEFMLLTNEITELTGKGADMVKPAAASQQTPAS